MNVDCLEIQHPLSWELSYYTTGQETDYSDSFGTHPTFLWIRDQPTYLGSGGKLRQTTTQPKWDSCFEEDRFTCYPVQKFTCKDSQKW